MDCPFAAECSRMGGICQCAEEQQEYDDSCRRSEMGDSYEGDC